MYHNLCIVFATHSFHTISGLLNYFGAPAAQLWIFNKKDLTKSAVHQYIQMSDEQKIAKTLQL